MLVTPPRLFGFGQRALFLIATCALSACGDAGADAPAARYQAPASETPSGRVLALRGVESAAEQAEQIVVQLARAPSPRLRARLESAGFRELAYLSSNALLLARGAAQTSALAGLDDVLGVTPYLARDRLSRELARDVLARDARAQVPLLVHVLPDHPVSEVSELLAAHGVEVLNSGALAAPLPSPLPKGEGTMSRISAIVPKQRAAQLAEQITELPGVFFVERVHHLGLFNDRSAGSIQSGAQGTSAMVTPIWAHGLRGEGQIVGLIDSGLDVDSCFFADSTPGKLPKTNTWSQADGYGEEVDASHRKVLAYDFLYSCAQWKNATGCETPGATGLWDNHGHGTHCSGSMVGNRPGAKNNGMAPEAKIVVQDGGKTMNTCSEMPGLGCPVIDLYPIFEQAYMQGVRVHNNSYGDNEEAPAPNQSNYTARSQDVDRFMWDHKDMLIVFAAGNAGMNNRDFSVGSPSTNKNGLSVGSVRTTATSNSDQDLSSFSSRGWSADGRIKPDIMAPGCTTSAGNDGRIDSNNCTEDTGCGTSYAAPILVGAAALVRQYFSEGFYPSGAKNPSDARTPSAALLKAMLLNGAVSLTGRDNSGQAISPIPSNEQGWGRAQLDRSLLFTGATRKLYVDDHSSGLASDGSVRYEIKGASSDEPLKITLVWTDYPGTPDSPPRMPSVGNIAALNAPRLVNDLDLSVQSGMASYLGNAFMNGKSAAGGEADRRNNVEQVLINASGDVSIVVKAANIAKETQDFALVVTGRWEQIGPAMAAAGMDAGAVSAPTVGDAGRNDAGSTTQTVSNPALTGSASEAGSIGNVATGSDASPPRGEMPAARDDDADGCACRVSERAPQRELLPWIALGLFLRSKRGRAKRGQTQ